MTVTAPRGSDLTALDRHSLREVGIPRDGELRAELISGGRSNLTFLVYDDASKWVLRRPPLHGLTPSAHDMAREYRVVAALADTPVPVAPAVTMRDDDSVLRAPFQMVEYVPGQVVRTRADLEALGGPEVVSDCVDGLIKVLVDLHQVDPDAVGLGDFGKPTGYLERQVRRWGSQWDYVRLPDDPRDDDVRRLHAKLAETVPHGEPRLDRARRLPHRQHHARRRGPENRSRRAGLGDVDARRPDLGCRGDGRPAEPGAQHDSWYAGGVVGADDAVAGRSGAPLFAGIRTSAGALGLPDGPRLLQARDHRRRHRTPRPGGCRRCRGASDEPSVRPSTS